MIVRQFLLWARSAPPAQRADAVAALAQAYLDDELSPNDRRDAQMALTAMLDDPSPLVRQALAETLADAPEAPRHVIVALAGDHDSIATVVLARSPVLMDADLVDCAALGGEAIQTAIARRPYVSISTSAALAEIACAGVLMALVGNPGAEFDESALWRIVERHGSNPVVRKLLLQRPDLPLDLRHAIAVVVSDALSSFVKNSRWLAAGQAERAFGDARDKATVALTTTATPGDVQRLVGYLRRTGQLTPALMLRALLSRSMIFVEAAFANLSGLPLARVAGLLHDRNGGGFSALYDRAGLPKSLKPAFAAAISAFHETDVETELDEAQLSQRMIERVLSACAELPLEDTDKLMALLRRYEAEAARETARGTVGALADDAVLALTYPREPMALIGVDHERLQDAA